MRKYCGVCNAPVTDWDENNDYGQCQEGHSVQAAYCTDEPKHRGKGKQSAEGKGDGKPVGER